MYSILLNYIVFNIIFIFSTCVTMQHLQGVAKMKQYLWWNGEKGNTIINRIHGMLEAELNINHVSWFMTEPPIDFQGTGRPQWWRPQVCSSENTVHTGSVVCISKFCQGRQGTSSCECNWTPTKSPTWSASGLSMFTSHPDLRNIDELIHISSYHHNYYIKHHQTTAFCQGKFWITLFKVLSHGNPTSGRALGSNRSTSLYKHFKHLWQFWTHALLALASSFNASSSGDAEELL